VTPRSSASNAPVRLPSRASSSFVTCSDEIDQRMGIGSPA
jgi:hypothetical protein